MQNNRYIFFLFLSFPRIKTQKRYCRFLPSSLLGTLKHRRMEETPPPPYEATVIVDAPGFQQFVTSREKRFKITTTTFPDFSLCHNDFVVDATKFYSFIIDELQYDGYKFDDANIVCNKLWNAFFVDLERLVFTILFACWSGHQLGYSVSYNKPLTNFMLLFCFEREDLDTGVKDHYTYVCMANFSLEQNKKRKRS